MFCSFVIYYALHSFIFSFFLINLFALNVKSSIFYLEKFALEFLFRGLVLSVLDLETKNLKFKT